MRMAKDRRIDRGRVKGKRFAVALVGAPAALDQATVEQDGAITHMDEMTGSGGFTGGADTLGMHAVFSCLAVGTAGQIAGHDGRQR
jgi:hypothetical protein